MLTSTTRRAFQSSGSDDSTPSRYAWSWAVPRGNSRKGAPSVRVICGGTRVTRYCPAVGGAGHFTQRDPRTQARRVALSAITSGGNSLKGGTGPSARPLPLLLQDWDHFRRVTAPVVDAAVWLPQVERLAFVNGPARTVLWAGHVEVLLVRGGVQFRVRPSPPRPAVTASSRDADAV